MYALDQRDFTFASSALGSTAPDISISSLGPLHLATIPKTLFSMVTPEVKDILRNKSHVKSVALFGIEVSCLVPMKTNCWYSSYSLDTGRRMFACCKQLSTSSILGTTCILSRTASRVAIKKRCPSLSARLDKQVVKLQPAKVPHSNFRVSYIILLDGCPSEVL